MYNQKTTEYLIAVIRSVLNKKECPNAPLDTDWEELFKLARNHSIVNIVAFGLAEKQECTEEKWCRAFCDLYKQAIAVDTAQEFELNWLSAVFKDKGIRFMPLKGSVIKKYYPKPDMRTMGDLDILIEPDAAKNVRDILLERGYESTHFGGEHHDEYRMPPFLHIEIHRNLISRDYKKLNKYFLNIFSRAVPILGNPFEYEMSIEDTYIFHLAHLYKHFNDGGAGIRLVIDHYVLLNSLSDQLDWEYIIRELKELKLYDFNQTITELANVWFSENCDVSFADEDLTNYIINSGTFGNERQFYKNKVQQMGRVKFFVSRLFPSFSFMKEHFPILQKIPILLPVICVWRILSYPILNKDLFIRRIQYIFRHK